MGSEVFTQEQALISEGYEVLQEALGVTEDIARDLASVEVSCPIPGEARKTTLGEFIAHPPHDNSEIVDRILDTAREARLDGESHENALHRALGFAAVMNKESGKLVRVSDGAEPPKKN